MKDKKGVWRRKEREADVGSIKIRNTDKQFILSTSFNSCVNWHLNRAKFINSYSGTYINYIYIYLSEKAMVPHSSTLAWKIPWTEEPGRLQSMGSLRVRHDWATSLSLFTFMHRRRKWQPTPVFLPRESQGRGSLVGLPSLGSHRVGHDWSDLAAAAYIFIFIYGNNENYSGDSFSAYSDTFWWYKMSFSHS